MLKFTPEQQADINRTRAAFNTRMTSMAEGVASMLEGNALSIPIDAWRRIDSRAQALARSRLQVFNRQGQLPVR